jgi:hypothetical protein
MACQGVHEQKQLNHLVVAGLQGCLHALRVDHQGSKALVSLRPLAHSQPLRSLCMVADTSSLVLGLAACRGRSERIHMPAVLLVDVAVSDTHGWQLQA